MFCYDAVEIQKRFEDNQNHIINENTGNLLSATEALFEFSKYNFSMFLPLTKITNLLK